MLFSKTIPQVTKYLAVAGITQLLFLILFPFQGAAQDTLYYTNQTGLIDIGQSTRFYRDVRDTLVFEQIRQLPDTVFKKSPTSVMNFDNTIDAIWLKLNIKNKTDASLVCSFNNHELQYIQLFVYDEQGRWMQQKGGYYESLLHRYLQRGSTVLNIGKTPQTVYIQVKSHASLYMPITVSDIIALSNANYGRDAFDGICIGIMIAMLFYNFFIYFLVKDSLYLYYSAYILISILTIAHLNGLGQFFIWRDLSFGGRMGQGQLLSITAALFTMRFLNTRTHFIYGHFLLRIFIVLMLLNLYIISILDIQPFGNNSFQMIAILEAITMLYLGILAYRRGNKSAKFYVLGWSIYLTGGIITLCSFMAIVPYNLLTFNALAIGTCLENILLAFALANRINIYRDASTKAQALAYAQLQENERLVREQNKVLEQKVQERIQDLQNTLDQLKATESQLVQSEKMASLGQLTAGIAHEINNPINFIGTSLLPLKRNIALIVELIHKYEVYMENDSDAIKQEIIDFKEEIDYDYTKDEIQLLISSIQEGSTRTTEIVKGLRNFSRLDEAEQKKTCINEGMESTLLLMQSNIKKKNIQLVKTLGEIPEINCYAGQVNQVFMNILTNAVQAMSEKGVLTIKTFLDSTNQSIQITIADTGMGMTEAVKNKIFDPFFTTKAVGEGTGLGLSISYGIIKKHNGNIEVESEVGKGTLFKITLPVQ